MKAKLPYLVLLLAFITSSCASHNPPVEQDTSELHLTELTSKRSTRLSKLNKQPIQMLAAITATDLCTLPEQIYNHMPFYRKETLDSKLRALSDPQTYLQPKTYIGDSGHLLASRIRYAQVYISQDAADLAQSKEKKSGVPGGNAGD
ncbi:MAG TPA: hypothetical protein VGH19_00580 [Verrucomicrobiae bacterium]